MANFWSKLKTFFTKSLCELEVETRMKDRDFVDIQVFDEINTYAIKSLVVPENVKSIHACTFNKCTNLKSIQFLGDVKSIGAFAFAYCKNMKKFVIPDSVTEVGMYAFANCSNLKEITIPKGVTTFGPKALENCKNLKVVYLEQGSPLKRDVFPENVKISFDARGNFVNFSEEKRYNSAFCGHDEQLEDFTLEEQNCAAEILESMRPDKLPRNFENTQEFKDKTL